MTNHCDKLDGARPPRRGTKKARNEEDVVVGGQVGGFLTIKGAVHELTGELGEFHGIDAGFLREGDRTDSWSSTRRD